MALAFVPRYRATLASKIGNTIQQWELCVYRSYENTDTTPSWATDPIKNLTFDKSGATLEYVGRYDIYKPIIGSKLQFTLKSIVEGEFDNLNEGGQYEYRVDLFSYDGAGQLKTLYWRGYILPADSSESLSFAPFDVTFEAIDGLGGLGDFKFPPPSAFDHHITTGDNLLLIDVLKYAVARTGLGLDIYVDSGIKQKKVGATSSIDALLHDAVVPYAFTGRALKELVEGILIAYNCRIIQTRGVWVIFNASIISTKVSWTILTWTGTAYTTKSSVTPPIDLTKTLHGRPGSDLLYLGGHQITRLPYGSIECAPKDLSPKYYLNDYNFENGLTGWNYTRPVPASNVGWTYSSVSLRNVAPTRPVFSTNQGEHLTGGRAITTNLGANIVKSDSNFEDRSTFWFMARTPANTVSVQSTINIDIYYLVKNINDREINSVRLITALILRTTSAPRTVYNYSFPDNDWTTRRIASDFFNSIFRYTGRGLPSEGSFFTESDIREEHQGVWRRRRISLPPSVLLRTFQGNPFQMDIGFFYPTCENSTGSSTYGRGGSTVYPFRNLFNLFIDRVEVYNTGATNVQQPHFERIQADWNTSYQYQPVIVDESPASVAQKIIKTTNLVSDGTEPSHYFNGNHLFPRTLEEVSTQLKLNDFADRLQTFELKVASNRTGIPLHALDRVKVDFNDFKSGYSASGDQTLFASGKFNLAEGTYNIICYSPNQTRNVAPVDRGTVTPDDYVDGNLLPGFYREDIDLVATEPITTDATDLPLTLDCVPPEDLTSNSATVVVRIRHRGRNFSYFNVINRSNSDRIAARATSLNSQGEYRWALTGLTPNTQYTYLVIAYSDTDDEISRKSCNFKTLVGHNVTTVYAISVNSEGFVKVLNYSQIPSIIFIGDVSDTVVVQTDIVIRSATLPSPSGTGTSAANEYSRKVYSQVAKPTLRRIRVQSQGREPSIFEEIQPVGNLPPKPTIVLTVGGHDVSETNIGYAAGTLTVGYRITDAQVSDLRFLFQGSIIQRVDIANNAPNPGTFEVAFSANPDAVSRSETLTALITNAGRTQNGFDTLDLHQAPKPSDCDGKRPILTFTETSKTADADGSDIKVRYPFTLKCADPANIQYVWNFGDVDAFASATTGTNEVVVSVDTNRSPSPRTATLQVVIANDVGTTRVNLELVQRSASSPTVTLSPNELSLPIAGGIAKFTYVIAHGVQSDLTLSDDSVWRSRTGFKFADGDLWIPVRRNCAFSAYRFAVSLTIRNSAGSGKDTSYISQPARTAYGVAPTLAWSPALPSHRSITLGSNQSGAEVTRNYTISNAEIDCDTTIINNASWLSVTRVSANSTNGLRFRAVDTNLAASTRSAGVSYRVITSGQSPVTISVLIIQPAAGSSPTIEVASAEKQIGSTGGDVTFNFDIENADGTDFTLDEVKSDVQVSGRENWVRSPRWSRNNFNSGNPYTLRLTVDAHTEGSPREDSLRVSIVQGGQTVAGVTIKISQDGLVNRPSVDFFRSSKSLKASDTSVPVEIVLHNASQSDLSFTNKKVLDTGCVIDTSITEGSIYDGTHTILDPSTQSDLQGTGRLRVLLGTNINTGASRSDTVSVIVDHEGGRDCDSITLNQAAPPAATITWDNPNVLSTLPSLSEDGFSLSIHYSVTNAMYSDAFVSLASVPDWITAGNPYRRGSDLQGGVVFTISENFTASERTANLRIEVPGGASFEVSFTQEAGSPPPPPAPTLTWDNPNVLSTLPSLSENGFSLSIHFSVTNAIYSNVSVSAPTVPSWITVGDATKRGSSDLQGAILVTVSANFTSLVRKATIRFQVPEGAYFDVAISQNAGSPPPPPSPTITWDNPNVLSTLPSLSENGFSLSIHYSVTRAIYSDVLVSPASIPDWVTVGSPVKRGTSDLQGGINVTVSANFTTSTRTATLRFVVTGGASFEVSFTQLAGTSRPAVPSLTVTPTSKDITQWEASNVAVSFGYSLQNGLRTQITLPTKPDCITLSSITGTNLSGTIALRVDCINKTFASVDRSLVAEVSNTGGKDTANFKVVQAGRPAYSADPTITAQDLTVPGPLTNDSLEFSAPFSVTNAIAFYDVSASFSGATGSLSVTRNSNRGSVTFELPPDLPNYVLNFNIQVQLTVTTNRGSVSKTIRLIDSRRP